MPAQTFYTFYGVIEDPYTNDSAIVDPNAFGYSAGQSIIGRLTLSGSFANLWTSAPPDARFVSTTPGLARSELDLFFPQPGGNWTGTDFASIVSLGSTNDTRPLVDVRATLFHSSDPDGPTLRFDQEAGGAILTNDDGREALIAGAWIANDSLTRVYGSPREDRLDLWAPFTFAWGGKGEDVITVRFGEAWIWGGEGDDTITGGGGHDFVWGGIGDDVIKGKGGNDFVNGGWGDDTLDGGSGNDRLLGGVGYDLIKGGDGNDTIDAGGGGVDAIYGGAGNDFLVSGQGAYDDSFELERSLTNAGSGNDTIAATFDAVLVGGSGADTFVLGGAVGTRQLNGLQIRDFLPGVDKLAIMAGEPGQFDTYAEIMSAAKQVSGNVVFDFFPTDDADLPALILNNVQLSSLSSSDFLFGDF